VLEPISDLEFFPELHRYRYKGRWLPFSVTKVANRVSERQERVFRETQHIWEPRGTSVHAYCESLLKGNEPTITNYTEWTEQLESCWLLKNSEPIAIEVTSLLGEQRAFGHKVGLSQDLRGDLGLGILPPQFEEVFCMEDTNDLIDIFFIKQNPGVAAFLDQLDDLMEGGFRGCGGDYGSWNHDGGGRDLLKIQDAVYHIRFFITDQTFGLTLIHQIVDLFCEVGTLVEMGFFPNQIFEETEQALF